MQLFQKEIILFKANIKKFLYVNIILLLFTIIGNIFWTKLLAEQKLVMIMIVCSLTINIQITMDSILFEKKGKPIEKLLCIYNPKHIFISKALFIALLSNLTMLSYSLLMMLMTKFIHLNNGLNYSNFIFKYLVSLLILTIFNISFSLMSCYLFIRIEQPIVMMFINTPLTLLILSLLFELMRSNNILDIIITSIMTIISCLLLILLMLYLFSKIISEYLLQKY